MIIDEFVKRSERVLRVSYHPTSAELRTTATIAGGGMVVIGIIGYILTIIFDFVEKVGVR